MNSSLFTLPFVKNYTKDISGATQGGDAEHATTPARCDRNGDVVGGVTLPNFNEFLRDTFVSKPLSETRDKPCTSSSWGHDTKFWEKKQMEKSYFTHASKVRHEEFQPFVVTEMGRTMDELISALHERIQKLESDVKKQDKTIINLENENQKMKEKKRKHEEVLKKRDETHSDSTESKKKERKLFMVVDEFEKSQQKANNQVKNLESFMVDWNGEKFVLIDAFSNKSDIVNYYYPLYQSNNPEKTSKMVLEREEYKKLFNTNPHVKESERKRAWRITIFSIDFYEFVKQQK